MGSLKKCICSSWICNWKIKQLFLPAKFRNRSKIMQGLIIFICLFVCSLVLMSGPKFGFNSPAQFTSCTEQVVLLIFCTVSMLEKHLSRIALWQPKLSLYCVLSPVCTVLATCKRMKRSEIKHWESEFGGVWLYYQFGWEIPCFSSRYHIIHVLRS